MLKKKKKQGRKEKSKPPLHNRPIPALSGSERHTVTFRKLQKEDSPGPSYQIKIPFSTKQWKFWNQILGWEGSEWSQKSTVTQEKAY